MIAAVVLAAGRASRFGATKQAADVDGRPMVTHAVDAARRGGVDHIVVVLGHDATAVAEVLPSDVEQVVNARYADGQATSLIAGIDAAGRAAASAVIVLLADEPDVRSTAVAAVVAAHREGAEVARVRYDDGVGHPVLLGRSLWPRLRALSGDVGAREVLDDMDVLEIPVDGRRPRDIDRTSDLPG